MREWWKSWRRDIIALAILGAVVAGFAGLRLWALWAVGREDLNDMACGAAAAMLAEYVERYGVWPKSWNELAADGLPSRSYSSVSDWKVGVSLEEIGRRVVIDYHVSPRQLLADYPLDSVSRTNYPKLLRPRNGGTHSGGEHTSVRYLLWQLHESPRLRDPATHPTSSTRLHHAWPTI